MVIEDDDKKKLLKLPDLDDLLEKKKEKLFKMKKILNKALPEKPEKKTKGTPVEVLSYLSIAADKTMEARVTMKKAKEQLKALAFTITGRKREVLPR